jgi:hypothetical protein
MLPLAWSVRPSFVAIGNAKNRSGDIYSSFGVRKSKLEG